MAFAIYRSCEQRATLGFSPESQPTPTANGVAAYFQVFTRTQDTDTTRASAGDLLQFVYRLYPEFENDESRARHYQYKSKRLFSQA